MNDDLQPLKNRLRWLNRSILVLGILILLGLIVWAVVGLRKPTPGTESTVIHPASSASNMAARAASAVAAAAPKPAMSTAQQERAAAAAMDALSAASAPKTVVATASQAARAASVATTAATPAEVASAPTKLQTAVVEAASSAVTAAASSKPVVKPVAKPDSAQPKSAQHKPAQHKPAVQARTEPARVATTAAKPSRVGAVGVCRSAGWYVQVGAFGKQQSIDRLASKLHRAGYTQVCVAAQQVRGLHLFYVGPYKNAASARDAKAPLHKLTGAEGILRKLD